MTGKIGTRYGKHHDLAKRPKPAPITTCYICGEPLGDRPTNRDHIPPDQILPASIRRKYAINFVTRKVHLACNDSFKLDEEYFVHCLIPFAPGTEAGDAIWRKAVTEYRAGKNRPLVNLVLSQAKERVGDVYLPPDKVALDYDLDRFERVVSKIVRGLYFCETETVIDPSTSMTVFVIPPGNDPPDHYKEMLKHPAESKGNHQGVFAYWYVAFDSGVHYWALLLWDKVIITAIFKVDPPPAADATEP
ncbi:hypothetical protein [Ancylobacter sp. SL191]|uniref:hypothetical protein n=1 Tax=Ancylobacter sp. SL191 TaxID=2995166 RepID=UPI0022710DE6|nr:hypothetical protein [Ancylobacter sp. SL191]WAC27873.1 hypothetical protein OU996_01990 [Ancylobacter sp. SL191]